MSKTAVIKKIAQEIYDNMVSSTRENGSKYYHLKETTQWQTDIIHKAHGESMPSDFIYDVIRDVLGIIVYTENEEDFQEAIDESLEADIYTSDLTAWLHDNNSNVYYLTEAMVEYGSFEDGFQFLSMAQLIHKREIAYALIEALEES